MRRVLILFLAVGLTSCGDHGGTPQAASDRLAEITKAMTDTSKLTPGANVKVRTMDAQGCVDQAKAKELIGAQKSEDTKKWLKLYGDGMKDHTCRGFAQGLAVAVDHKEGDLTCILPGDDPDNKQCFWISSAEL